MLDKIRGALSTWGFYAVLILLGLLGFYLLLSLNTNRGARSERPPMKSDTPIEVTKAETNYDWMIPEDYVPPAPEPTVSTQPVTVVEAQPIGAVGSSGSLNPGREVPGRNAVFVFRSYGRAHGVGLCMDGVMYRALAGQSAYSIINYYYTGVTISQISDSQPVRVKGRDGRIRVLPMNEYLYRLVEEPDSYPFEGLKVLFIAARTYTLSCISRGKHAGQGFDICSSGNCCQAFDENRDLSRVPNSIAAVNATRGQVLLSNGAPIVAAYCGSCGGHTENNEDVWGGAALPYLRGKPDPYCSRSPRYSASVELSVSELEAKLNSSSATSIGQIKLVDLSNRTPGGRVRTARLVGSSGTKVVSGGTLAKLLGLPTTRLEYSFR